MVNPFQFLHKKFSARLSLWVLFSVTILIVAALTIMFRFSHNAIEKESLAKAEETLNGTVHRINNMLYEVEVATTNMRWNVEHHLDNPNAMTVYTREIVKNNPSIIGCAIAFEPNYYKERGELFMTYSYRDKAQPDSIVTNHNPMEIEPNYLSEVPYMAHNWYFIPKKENTVCWVRPHAPTEKVLSATVACCMPIHEPNGRVVGVLTANISVDWLSSTILNTKPYPNSYCCMLGVQGTYIIHPDSTRLYHALVRDIIKDSPDERVEGLVESMLAGESGCRAVELSGENDYVLYKSLNNGHWSACIVCPESDIFSANERLEHYMIGITIFGLMVIFIFCMIFINQQMSPLDMLSRSAQRIAKGEYALAIPATKRADEIGTLQNSFSSMQKALSQYIEEISQLSTTLKERNVSLNDIYAQIQESDMMKTTILHKIADKMIPPVKIINSMVRNVHDNHANMKPEEILPVSDIILKQIKIVTDLLDKMTNVLQK